MQREVWIKDNPNEDMPIFWDYQDCNGRLYGKKGKVHTVLIPVQVPKLRMDYKLSAIDPKGKLVIREGESHSLTRNYYNWACSSGGGVNAADATNFQDGNINAKDTDGTVRSGNYGICTTYLSNVENASFGYYALATISTSGIQVGTSDHTDHPESENDYVLPHLTAHGVGADQLFYQTSVTPAGDSFNAGTRVQSRVLTRFFNNFSGGSITLKEIGQVGNIWANNAARNILVARDLIDDLVVADKSCAAISYTYSLVFPSTGSPLRNYYNYLFSQFASVNGSDSAAFADGNINIKDTVPALYYSNYCITFNMGGSLHGATNGFMGASGFATYGLVIGLTNTAVLFNDAAMAGLIAHGTGANQMSYPAQDTPFRTWADPVMTITHGRTITNNSANPITVVETGLIGALYISTTAYTVLCLRDVISPVVVAVGESIKPIYNFQVTFP